MKRTALINRHLSTLVASLGHRDEIIIADAGLPIPDRVPVIDLAVVPGLPRFQQVLAALRSELAIESAVHALEARPDLIQLMQAEINIWQTEMNITIPLDAMAHDAFKQRSQKAKAIIRTGEVTPYANIILISGVVF